MDGRKGEKRRGKRREKTKGGKGDEKTKPIAKFCRC